MPKLQILHPPESLARLAYDALLKSILSGELNSNEIYNEMALAKELGISRTPVREALLELSVQGLVKFLPRKGITVCRFTRQDIVEIFEIRRAIETACVEKIARMSPRPDLHRIQKTIAEQRAAISNHDLEAFLHADRDFHVRFSELTTNRRMKETLENVRNMIHLMGDQALRIPGRAKIVVKEHEAIVRAVKKGKPDAARQAMLDHLVNSERAVMEAL